MNYSRTKAIKSVKNVLSFGRNNSCDERQSLFSRESSLESDVETLNDCDINTINTETENFSAEESSRDIDNFGDCIMRGPRTPAQYIQNIIYIFKFLNFGE